MMRRTRNPVQLFARKLFLGAHRLLQRLYRSLRLLVPAAFCSCFHQLPLRVIASNILSYTLRHNLAHRMGLARSQTLEPWVSAELAPLDSPTCASVLQRV